MASQARQLADKSIAPPGRRNLFINGAMTIAQRGTSEGPSSLNGVLALDRWYVNSSGGTKTISQQTFTVGQTDVPGFPKNYVRLEVTTGDNNTGIHQRVEDVTSIAGKTVTVSFWAKGTNPTGGSFVSSWIQVFGSGGSSSVETEAKSGIVLTSSWQKFTITFTVPSVVGKTIGAGSYTWVELLRQPATDTGTGAWTADIALAQLEVGSTATEFEYRSFGEELALCQRYYYMTADGSAQDESGLGISYGHSDTESRFVVNFPVTMRTTPSLDSPTVTNAYRFIHGATSSATAQLASSLTLIYPNWNTEHRVILGQTGLTDNNSGGKAGYVQIYNSSTAYVAFDAEL